MGADLFGSLAESTCAALVVSSTSKELILNKESLFFPLSVTAAGVLASFLSVLCIHVKKVTVQNVQAILKAQIGLSTLLMTACVVPVIYTLPPTFSFMSTTAVEGDEPTYTVSRW
jgi:Na+/H+-translocating membrane pyrophosphatase